MYSRLQSGDTYAALCIAEIILEVMMVLKVTHPDKGGEYPTQFVELLL
jgi:hypothetical protein